MKDIIGYEGLYAVTTCGRVWSYRKNKFLAQRYDKDGYLRVDLHKDKKLRTFQVHRLVGMAFIECDRPFDEMEVHHKNRSRAKNYKSNLQWLTREEHQQLERETKY